MKTFPLLVLKITETVFEGEVESVTVPGSTGELTILAKHETMLSSLKQGLLSIKDKEGVSHELDITHGFLEATSDKVIILL